MINPLYFINENIPLEDDCFDALCLEGIISKREKWDVYNFFGINVPRVSEILKDTIGKDYLMKWALNLGKEVYERESRETLITGTIVHEMIEYFLIHGDKKEADYRSYQMKRKAEQAYYNFVSWYRDMIKNGHTIKPLFIEREIVCPWYGGTIDCIMEIDGNTYIIDFKTSRSISMDYLLQTYAYYWSIKWNRNNLITDLPDIDGIGVIRIDKDKDKYEFILLDGNHNEDANRILSSIGYSFSSMINWYYHQQDMKYQLKQSKMIKEI
jgi:hypothetical protein